PAFVARVASSIRQLQSIERIKGVNIMVVLGLLLIAVGTIWIIVNAFGQSVWWGIGSLLLPFVALIFALMNFAENKLPLLLYIAGIVLFVMGGGVTPAEFDLPAEM
ncbi:MAG: hypothetical protein ABI650_10825, partial [Dokdonella sp.]